MDLLEVMYLPMLLAIIAGLISLLGLVISKEHKISDFRQSWIDSLRVEIASLISHATAIYDAVLQADCPNKVERFELIKLDLLHFDEAMAKIKLRLNPDEKDARLVLNYVEELYKLVQPQKKVDGELRKCCEDNLVGAANVLLKKEWEQVRRGEPVFRGAKYLSGLVLIVLILAVFCMLYGPTDVAEGSGLGGSSEIERSVD